MNNLEKYNNVFIRVFDVDENSLNSEFTFKSVETWDSMSHLTLITELEDTFDVMFKTEDILHFGGYENGKNILKKYGTEIE